MLSYKLKNARTSLKLTQSDLAKKVNTTKGTISNYENGHSTPSNEMLVFLADALNVTTDYLLGRSDNQGVNKSAEVPNLPMEHFTYLPVVAEISCGIPTFTQDEIIEFFPADKNMLNGGEYVWLKAKGDSMINAMIADGSKVLLRLQPMVENGEIAAVCIDEEDATLKKVYFSEETVTLVSENSSYRDQVFNKSRVTIKGKAVYVGSAL